MDPRSWVDQLFTYGPYAVLALFVLWVAPAQLKAFRQGLRENRTQQAVSGFVAIGCWLIVFAMVYYIYLFWPPRTVYLGSFGVHRADAHFYPAAPSGELFVSSRPVGTGNRLAWDYVIVTDPHQTGDFNFAYQWGGPDDQKDFSLPRSVLQKRRIDLYPNPDPAHPDILLWDDDSDPVTQRKPYPPIEGVRVAAMPAAHVAIVGTALAQARAPADNPDLLEWLAFPNGNLRAQAERSCARCRPTVCGNCCKPRRFPPPRANRSTPNWAAGDRAHVSDLGIMESRWI